MKKSRNLRKSRVNTYLLFNMDFHNDFCDIFIVIFQSVLNCAPEPSTETHLVLLQPRRRFGTLLVDWLSQCWHWWSIGTCGAPQ